MASSFLEQKYSNAVKWLCRCVLKYGPPNNQNVLQIVKKVNSLIDDENIKKHATNPIFLGGVISQLPPAVFDVVVEGRELYHISDEQRLAFVEKQVADFRQTIKTIGEILDYVEAHKEEVASDLRNLGAYTEIFFGPFIENRIDIENKQQE